MQGFTTSTIQSAMRNPVKVSMKAGGETRWGIGTYLDKWGDEFSSGFAPEVYSTAWLALVPDLDDPQRPAWPEALRWLRDHQLPDGGWGEPSVLYAHERTVSTLAAMRALATWSESDEDRLRVERGLAALWAYAPLLKHEPCETIGFELVLPRLWQDCRDLFTNLPDDDWAYIEELGRQKFMLIMSLQPKAKNEAAWWFSLEMLPEIGLATLDDEILAGNGSVATSVSSTAAYLWAKRRAGGDSRPAMRYLDNLVRKGQGGVPFAAPVETFERLWVLDNLRRGGISPSEKLVVRLIELLKHSWNVNSPGLSSSDYFSVNDGDSTAIGTMLMWWAGLAVSDQALLGFWDEDHLRSYLDERGKSISVNVHALSAMRMQPGFPHREMALKVTDWLLERMSDDGVFADKWQLSPYYTSSRVIPVFAKDDWCPKGAERAIDFIRQNQRESGGWSWFDTQGTLEETALCLLGLCSAVEYGRFTDLDALERGVGFMVQHIETGGHEALWIGKTLYRSNAIVWATIDSALRRSHSLFQSKGLLKSVAMIDRMRNSVA